MLHYNLSGESGRRTGLHRVWQLSRIFAFVKTSRFARLDVWYLISLGLIALLIITCMVLVHQQTVLILLSVTLLLLLLETALIFLPSVQKVNKTLKGSMESEKNARKMARRSEEQPSELQSLMRI